ncbi:DUF3572 domain-containing protein [Parasphingorhabdus halotolerans]|uniref:DUF3572 domain-containing protein n=1 Tax=Parasphingorhabdus halotolerans TaxID=2725558 RepID=A0A6H2DNR4_9SPHN|nr:DUF3572 domain-containing protein [Parasphingorhabdus halotolerans]QJB69623.1 DUF3572 domain-containing protein [Parasphingorhabdus halotolerans]
METNPNISEETEILALKALGWVLEDSERAQRLLALTGLDPRDLRSGLEDPAMLTSLLGFLANHEPDLLACAEAIDVEPARLAAAAEYLNNPGDFS